MDAIIAFIVAAIISFIGSVLLGLVNVATIDTAINKTSKSALWLAFGGVLPEIPYTLIAIFGTSYVDFLSEYQQIIGIAVGIVFLILGVSYIYKKMESRESKSNKINETGAFNHFAKGFLLALANPQLIFFWSTILILLQTGSFNIRKDQHLLIDFEATSFISPKISFAIGAAVGAFIILCIYIKLSSIYKNQLLKLIGDKLSKIVGGIFIIMGIFVIIKNVI